MACECAAKDSKIRELEDALVAMARQNNPEWYEDAVKACYAKLRESESQREEQLAYAEDKLRALARERDDLLAQRSTPGFPVAALDELKTELATLLEEKQELTVELAKFKARVHAIDAAHATLVTENNAHVASLAQSAKSIESLIAAGAQLIKQLGERGAEVDALTARLEESDEIIVFLDKLLLKGGPGKRLALLEHEIAEGRVYKARYEAARAKNDQLAEQLSERAAEKRVATSVMKQMEAQMYELRQEKERLEEAVAHSSAAKRVLAPSAAANSQLSRVPIGPAQGISSANAKENGTSKQDVAERSSAAILLAKKDGEKHGSETENAICPNCHGTPREAPGPKSAQAQDYRASLFGRATEATLLSLPEPQRCQFWQDMMLVARPGHRVSQRELYGAYAQDCRAPGVAPPLDGAGFFAALRYGFFQASLVHSGEEYVVDGVALREVDDDASDEVQPEAAPAAVVPTHDPDNPFCASSARARASLAAPSSLPAHDPDNPFYSSPTAHESPKRNRPVEEAEDGARKRQRSSPEAEESDHDGAPAKRGRGRPKGSKNKSTLAKAVEEKPKRPIGRPPKPKPAVDPEAPPQPKRPRGRPPKPKPVDSEDESPAAEHAPSASAAPLPSAASAASPPASPQSSPGGPAEYDPDHTHTSPWDADGNDFFVLWLRHDVLGSVLDPSAATTHLQKLGWAEADVKSFNVPPKSKYFRRARFSVRTVHQALGY